MGLAGAHVSTSRAGSLGIISIDGLPDIEAHHGRGWQAHYGDRLYRDRTLARLARQIRDDLLAGPKTNHRQTAKKRGPAKGRGANRYDRVAQVLDKIGQRNPDHTHPPLDDRIGRLDPQPPPPNRYDRAHPQPPPPDADRH
jgi:hypothetical protein